MGGRPEDILTMPRDGHKKEGEGPVIEAAAEWNKEVWSNK